MQNLFFQVSLPYLALIGSWKGKDERCSCNGAEGKIDVEAALVRTFSSGTKMRSYHHLQDMFWVNAPPIRGPATEANANVAESMLCNAGRICGGEEYAIMRKLPEKVPAQPVPVIARPAMKVALLRDTAETMSAYFDFHFNFTYRRSSCRARR